MLEGWVVISTVRPNCAIQSALEVMQSTCNLAMAVNGQEEDYSSLITVQNQFPSRFILEFGNWRQSVEATNHIYGIIRQTRSRENIIAFPIPDDMRLEFGWWDGFCSCYNGLSINNGIAVISCNDGRTGCALAGFAGLTAAYCDTYQNGWLLCPEYLHWYLDFDMTEIAKREGVFYQCPNVKAFHEMKDHKENETSSDFYCDKEVWARRREDVFSYDHIPDATWRRSWGVSLKPKVVSSVKPISTVPKVIQSSSPTTDADRIAPDADIYVFCSTKGRGEQAKRIINNIMETSPSSCFLCMTVAGDTREYQDIIGSVRLEYKDRIAIFHNPGSSSFSYSVNQMWNKARVMMPGKNILGIATADDMEFKPKWFEFLKAAYYREFKIAMDGLMFLTDLRAIEMRLPNAGKSGMCMVSAKFCDLHMGGWLVSPYYDCNWIDIEYGEVAERCKKRKICLDALVYHLLVDFDDIQNRDYYKQGEELFAQRSRNGFTYEDAPWRYWK